MDAALVASAALLGIAGSPHCAAMCGAACTALTGRSPGGAAAVGFHAGRVAGYAATGAVAAASIGALAQLGQWSPALRPLWTLAHVAAMTLGLWLIWTGRQPAWLERFGRRGAAAAGTAGGWQRMRGPTEATVAGSLWFAWPCGLLQSALVVAALANGPVGGAAVMVAFALSSGVGLVAGPWLWLRLGGTAAAAGGAWAVRVAGGLLAATSGWALGHGLWEAFAAYCAT